MYDTVVYIGYDQTLYEPGITCDLLCVFKWHFLLIDNYNQK